MATYLYDEMRKQLNDEWAATILDETYKEYEKAKLVGNSLFPTISHDKDTLERIRDAINIYPMSYRGLKESSSMRNVVENMYKESLTFALKAEKDQLDMSKLDWVKFCDSFTAKQWTMLKSAGAQYIARLVRSLELRNEMEVWQYLTTSRITTIDDIAYDLPVYGLNVTDIATGICFHTREDWFTNGGAIAPAATIVTDIQTALLAMATSDFDMPTTMWMNSVTYGSLLGNTQLNTQVVNVYNPLNTRNFLGQDINYWDTKGIQLSCLHPFANLTVALNNGKYRNASGVLTKFIPDYYVIFTPSKVGSRYVVPNPETWTPDRWARTIVKNDPSGFFFEVGERSLPYPDNLEWKSHYVLYVKAV